MDVFEGITALADYGVRTGLIEEADRTWAVNALLAALELDAYEERTVTGQPALTEILDSLLNYACANGLCQDSVVYRDLFDTKLMGLLTPRPSAVIRRFWDLYAETPKAATDDYYAFSKTTNYIRADRLVKDAKWITPTPYGDMDITINLSKPEKDPKAIAAALQMKQSAYPKCQLCKENEGYAGRVNHPARQNHRIIPLEMGGGPWFLQYSPYGYYNEHCIVFNAKHTPMKIDEAVFVKLLDFVRQFPHYTLGSNADLPIVGGSILSHDHFQGGAYTFAMAEAPYEYMFEIAGFEDVTAGCVKWPLSVIRLQGNSIGRLAKVSDYILQKWRGYTDEEAFIFSETDGVPHNTITPIARMNGNLYEMDLVLRNNITTEDRPWGVYHPEEKLHHIKKENIGLIEVMGLAVLPSRLKKEMDILAKAIIEGKNIHDIEEIKIHADWVDEWLDSYDITTENIESIIQKEIADCFVQVLECAGVYKRTEKGFAAFKRFLSVL